MPISYSIGAYKPSWSEMIEFKLKIDSRITRAVAPLIAKSFSDCGKISTPSFPYIEEEDEDLSILWKESLKDDMVNDRQCLARLLNNPRFAHGYVEVDIESADLVLRAITEVRLHIRQSCLEHFSDTELETGEFALSKKPKDEQSYYLAYLVLAEVQEGLISQLV